MAASTEFIARWASEYPREETEQVFFEASIGLLDAIGCMVAGSGEEPVSIVIDAVTNWGGGPASILGRGLSLAAPWAAMVNGVACHVLDYDDSFAPLVGHVSAPIVPAILALAEERGLSGGDVLDAYVIGVEIAASVGRSVNPVHYSDGWHSTSTIGVIAGAAACSRLLRGSPEVFRNAISLAVSQAAGTRVQLGSPAKSFHAGLAAKSAIIAAVMAERGLSAAGEALDSRWGFGDMYARGFADSGKELPENADNLAIRNPGIIFKPYPTCGSTHRSLNSILDLRTRYGFGSGEVEAVELVIPKVNYNNLGFPDPQTGMEARFSLQYCSALALAHGSVRPVDFSDEAAKRPDLRPLMGRISVGELNEGDENTDYLSLPAHCTIRLKDGRELRDTRFARLGSREAPLAREEHLKKFEECAAPVIGPENTAKAQAMIMNLFDEPDLVGLMTMLRDMRNPEHRQTV